jgi:hypothetical protein
MVEMNKLYCYLLKDLEINLCDKKSLLKNGGKRKNKVISLFWKGFI